MLTHAYSTQDTTRCAQTHGTGYCTTDVALDDVVGVLQLCNELSMLSNATFAADRVEKWLQRPGLVAAFVSNCGIPTRDRWMEVRGNSPDRHDASSTPVHVTSLSRLVSHSPFSTCISPCASRR